MSEQVAVEEVKQGEPVIRQLPALRFKLAEYERAVYVVTTESGVTKEEILRPAFWAHVAAKLLPYDHIEVRAEDGEFWGELLVLEAGRLSANVHALRWVRLSKPTALTRDEAREFTHKFAGPHNKWQVIRVADSAVIKDEIATEAAAKRWITSHVKALRH